MAGKHSTRTYRYRRERKKRAGLREEATAWCLGRNPWVRLPLLVYGMYLTYRFAVNLSYSPIFDALNFGIHEVGHVLFSPFGLFMSVAGGSLTQCLAPVVSAVMFYRQRDFFAIAFCFGWLGMNFFDVAVYVADARAKALPLVSPFGGDPIHDWHFLLSRVGVLSADKGIAAFLRLLGFGCTGVFLIGGAWLLWTMHRNPRERAPDIG